MVVSDLILALVVLLLGFLVWQFQRLINSVDNLNSKMELVLYRLPIAENHVSRVEKKVVLLEKLVNDTIRTS